MRRAIKRMKGFIGVVIILVMICGCRLYASDHVVHDELFTYDQPFDITYLRILEAIEKNSEWRLLETNKEKGTIVVITIDYTRRDKATILVSRVERKRTSVELAPDSQEIRGIESLLKDIDQYCLR